MLAISFFANAQKNSENILFTIDGKPYYTEEFKRVYNKNLDLVKDESQKDLDKYLDLFIGYKLKVAKAYKIGLNNSVQYQNELKSNRTQLSKNYTTDSKVTKELVNEGYERSKKEINASHILFQLDENAAPQDTLAVFNKALEIRARVLKGENFETLAQEFSQDPSAKENKGNLGYFTSFRMVYAFENAAYKTPLGQVSNPVRTQFGYHLIKVNDVRDNRGEVSVAHIMILNPKDDDTKSKEETEKTINDVYKKLLQGESFDELAKQFSQDKSSSNKGGVLNQFGSGQLSSEEFETVAFSLTKDNALSKPFQSQFGWHIVKLIDKYPIKTLEESRVDLEGKISKDERSRLITNSLTSKLKKKYPIKRDELAYKKVSAAVTNDFYEGKWVLPENTKAFDGKLITISKKEISGTDFLNYIKAQQMGSNKTKPVNKLVDVLYNNFVEQELNQYYNDNLENEFPEFAAVIEEYRDGLLLFDLMEKEIWQRAKTDTVGLKNFFETQKGKHLWKTRANIIVASSTDMATMKKALTMLKTENSPEDLKAKLNTKDVINIMASEALYEEDADGLPKNTVMKVGVSDIIKQGDYYYLTKVLKVIAPTEKTLDECRGKVANDYQQYLEENWVNELKKEFAVVVNSTNFEKVKKQLKK